MVFKIDKRSDDALYIVGWCIIGVLFLLGVLQQITGIDAAHLLSGCVFHRVTGYYCPGCGGTRAVQMLLGGDIIKSLIYHPFVPYIAVTGSWFMLSQTIERLSRGRIRIAMHFREVYLWVALGIVAVNFLFKNLGLIIWHVDLLMK